MSAPEKTGLWCKESPNNPISTKLKRHAPPIVALLAATILAVTFFSYISYVANHPVIQEISQPDVPVKHEPTYSNTTQQPYTIASQQLPTLASRNLPPDYPSTTPSEAKMNRVLVHNFTEGNSQIQIYFLFFGENLPTLPAGIAPIGPIEAVDPPTPFAGITIIGLGNSTG